MFVSHGAPDLLLHDLPVRRFLQALGGQLPRPRAVLCISAHWTTAAPRVDASASPRTIHDFAGFPEELDSIRYPAPGDPVLARDVAQRLAAADIPVTLEERGLDHGAWVPLSLMYPRADVPVVQIALQPRLGTAHHVRLGRALADLRHEGVLVLGSGGASHNLGELGAGDEAPGWVREFDGWLRGAVEEGDEAALVDYRRRAPDAERNHPTEEHFLPLHVAFGAAGKDVRGRVLHQSFTYRVLSMTAFTMEGTV